MIQQEAPDQNNSNINGMLTKFAQIVSALTIAFN